MEGLENELWHRWSNRRIGEWAVMWVKRQKGWWMRCDVGEAKEGLENGLWRNWSNIRVGEWAVMQVKWHKGWRMSCDIREVTELILQPLSFHLHHNSFSNPSVALLTSQLILQSFCCFTYITAHSPTLLSLLLHHSLFIYVTWRAAHACKLDLPQSNWLLEKHIIRLDCNSTTAVSKMRKYTHFIYLFILWAACQVTYMKRQKGWRMNCDVGEAM